MSCLDQDQHGNGLPTEILYEIFNRLPCLEPVYRFRCVSKLWNSLLSAPSFLNKIYKIIPNPPWVLIHHGSTFKQRIPLSPAHASRLVTKHEGFTCKFLLETDAFQKLDRKKVSLMDSCSNGLVLCSTHDISCMPSFTPDKMFYVCNPLTRQWVPLPPRTRYDFEYYDDLYHLVCDQSDLTHNFKVVHTVRPNSQIMKCFQIFSSDTGRWDSYEVEWHTGLYGPGGLVLRNGVDGPSELVIRKGVLYWTERQLDRTMMVMAYRLLENRINRCRSIAVPEYKPCDPRLQPNRFQPDPQHSSNVCLGEAGGSIYYGQIHATGPITGYICVWLLEDDCSNVGLAWRLVYPKIELIDYGPSESMEFMCLNLLDRNVVIIVDRGCYIAYNITTKTYEILPRCPIGEKGRLLLITPKPTIITDWKRHDEDVTRGGGSGGEHRKGGKGSAS